MKYQIRLFCLLQATILLFISNGSLAFGRGRLRSMNDLRSSYNIYPEEEAGSSRIRLPPIISSPAYVTPDIFEEPRPCTDLDDADCQSDDFSNQSPSLINRYEPPGRFPLPVIDGHPYFPIDHPRSIRSKGSRSARKPRRTVIDYYPYSRSFYPARWEDYDN